MASSDSSEINLEINPAEAREQLEREGEAVLIDVREPEEYALARVASSQLMPMNTIPAQVQTLEALGDERTILLLCHHGVRSLQVAAWLRGQGVENCFSVAGGIDRWSLEVDRTIPRY
jgi:rhodanese-related sulfurtransferase